jgi:methylated-DNA-[protein]-cysteine S-methyltransferase
VAAGVTIRVGAHPTPLGELLVARTDDGIVATSFTADLDPDVFADRLERRHETRVRREGSAASIRRDLRGYFGGKLKTFATPVDLSIARTSFWRRVFEETIAVPFGETRTYGDLAAAAGSPRAWRAAGHAMRTCPIELWIPCHRIVPSGPGLGNYGGHPERREFLLRLERAI